MLCDDVMMLPLTIFLLLMIEQKHSFRTHPINLTFSITCFVSLEVWWHSNNDSLALFFFHQTQWSKTWKSVRSESGNELIVEKKWKKIKRLLKNIAYQTLRPRIFWKRGKMRFFQLRFPPLLGCIRHNIPMFACLFIELHCQWIEEVHLIHCRQSF